MAYRERRPRANRKAHLRSMQRLESAMRAADMSGAELARAVGISVSWLGAIRTANDPRTGQAPNVGDDIAVAIEQTLGQRRGALFAYGAQVEDGDLEGATP